MKLAFTSCSDPVDWPQQKVWSLIARQRPDHLLLLGDQIYMDYGKPVSLNPDNGEPAGFDDLRFAAHMYLRYQRQWAAMRGSGLWQLPGLQVHGIWDDHDFAWNNSYAGAGPVEPGTHYPAHELPVPPRKQQIARHLFRQFFQNLRALDYPPNELAQPARIDTLDDDLRRPVVHSDALPAGVPGRVTLGAGIHLLLTDGRSFRSSQDRPKEQRTLLGHEQMEWLQGSIEDGAISIIASGCTLDQGNPLGKSESWSRYPDYQALKDFLQGRQDARVLLLSGDVHKTDIRHDHGPRLLEVVASGAGRPWGKLIKLDKGNFALLEIGHRAITVHRHEGEPPEGGWKTPRVIDRASWRVQ